MRHIQQAYGGWAFAVSHLRGLLFDTLDTLHRKSVICEFNLTMFVFYLTFYLEYV